MQEVKKRKMQLITCLYFAVVIVLSEAVEINSEDALEVRDIRSDDGGPLEVVVQQLAQQVNSLNAELMTLKAKTATLDQTVAFHAWSTHNPLHVAGGAILVLDHVATNVGNAYDSLTGVFSAPLSGLYDFQVSIMANGPAANVYAHGYLYVDSAVVGSALSDSQHGHYSQATVRAIVHVNSGQRVYVKNINHFDSDYYDNMGEPYTTFSGVLVKAD